MSASLPPRPSLQWLRKTAKHRLARLREQQPDAKLADAQLAVARDHGFPSWRKLKAHIERLQATSESAADRSIGDLLAYVRTGRVADARAVLDEDPTLANAHGPHPYWGGRPQPLHMAVESKQRDVFDLVLEYGADVDGDNEPYDHWSPLMLAADEPYMRAALLRRGADVGLPEALLLADDDRVDTLLRAHGLPDVVPNAGSLLAFARTIYAIDRLLEHGARFDQADRWGATPLDTLSRLGARGHALVQHLIARGATAAPAQYARLGDRAVLTRLVEADPSIARLEAVLMAAVDAGHHDIVTWLLDRGAFVNARTDPPSRHTALHAAAWNGDLRMVELLVAAGADTAARDDQYDAPPVGWAATSIEVTHNARCADVVAYLTSLGVNE